MMMVKEIVGIYLDSGQIEAVVLRREKGKWLPLERAPWSTPDPRRPLAEQLRGVLSPLKPTRRRRICIGLARDQLFIREIALKGLSIEEAEAAVRLAVGAHAHLAPSEIYFDARCLGAGEETRVFLAYAPRKLLDPIFSVLEETGHRRSLWAVSPATLGLDMVLRNNGVKGPFIVIGQQGEGLCLSLHGPDSWEGSHLIKGDGVAMEEVLSLLPEPYRLDTTPKVWTGGASSMPEGIPSMCAYFGNISDYCRNGALEWAVCAGALGLSPFPPLSLGQGERKRPLSTRIRAKQLATAALAALVVGATAYQGMVLYGKYGELRRLESKIASVESKVAPLMEKQKELERIKKVRADIMEFYQAYPSNLVVLKALADLTPKEAWIKSYTYKKGVVKVSAEGGSAVTVMGAWRKSPLFLEVKLISPVTKIQGRERYSVELRVKSRGTGS